MLKNFLKDESGASMIEYGLLAGLIAVAAISAVGSVGDSVKGVFEDIAGALNNV